MDWEKLVNTKMRDWHVKPSPPDERDWPLQAITGAPAEIPVAVTLEPYFPFVLDQGKNPYCAGYSGAEVGNSYFNSIGQLPPGGFSPAWIYWQAREIDGLDPKTDGTTIRAVLQVMQKVGMCPESLCPTLPGNTKPKFTDVMYKEAEKYKIKAYARLNVGTLDEIQQAIASGRMVITGSFVTLTDWADGWILTPEGILAGGHATVHLAYDRTMRHTERGREYANFSIGPNSWGTGWGFNGFYRMAESYAKFRFEDFGGMPALMEAWAVEFDQPFKPVLPPLIKEFDVAPIILNGRTMVELRSLANVAGAQEIKWDEASQKVTLEYSDKTVILYIGKKEYQIIPK